MRTCLAVMAALSMLALAACTSTESVLDISSADGPTPPAPIGIETAAAQNPVGFASDPQADEQLLAQSQPVATMAPNEPVQAAPIGNAQPSPVMAPPAAPPSVQPQQVAAIPSGTSVQVAPIVGATARSVAPLSQRLALRAAERGLSLTNQPGGSHVLKGYFSAMQQDGKAVIIYVWDVLDAGGNRVHRIQGQESARMSGSDPWASIGDSTMETIADKTVDDLAGWIGGMRG